MKLNSIKRSVFATAAALTLTLSGCINVIEPDETPTVTPIEVNLITKISETETYFGPGWNQDSTVVAEGNLNDGYIYNLPVATYEQWQAQVKLTTDAKVVYGKAYKFTTTITPTADLKNITVKMQMNGNSDEANNTLLFVNDKKINLKANTPNEISIVCQSLVDLENALLIFDFGGNPAASIKIENIKLVETVYNEPEFIPSTKPSKGTAEVTNVAPEKINIDGIEYKYVWSDEFTSCESDGTPLKSKWGYDVGRGMSTNTDGTFTNNWAWGNNELQWYSEADADNTFVSDGTLKLSAIREDNHETTWSSGRIVTRNIPGAQFKYGYIEMKAKVPYDKGVWPAFWMLDNDIYDGQNWPLSGELDIMETSRNIWNDEVYGTIHCQAGHGGNPICSNGTNAVCFEDGLFHTYGVNWAEDHIDWYYDGEKVFSYTPADVNSKEQWPFNEEFYIIINLAVGGNLGGAVPASLNKSTMEIDYVRVYQK